MAIDENTQGQLIALLPRLRRFAFGLTGSREDADDLVQCACERALKKLHLWQKDTSFDSWMFRITKNIWIDTWRSRKKQGVVVELNEADGVLGRSSADALESRHLLKQVSQAMQQLPEEQRLVLILVSVEEMSYKEAAAILDIPLGTVMSRLARARRKLSELIA